MVAADPDWTALRASFQGRIEDSVTGKESFGTDATGLRAEPSAVVAPEDPSDLVRLIAWARSNRVPLVARGGGTSLTGGSVAFGEAIVVDFSRWDSIHEIDAKNRWARVGPGVINRALQRKAASEGLFFPPNPGSWETSTLGGNAATNASGPRSFRYGSFRRWALQANLVLGTGERFAVGTRSSKRSVGPELLDVFIGSEGILGLFVDLTVRLAPIPPRRTALAVPLNGKARVGPLAQRLAAAPQLTFSAIEYLDALTAGELAEIESSRLPSGPAILLLEVESQSPEEEDRQLGFLQQLLNEIGETQEALVFPDADALWSLRGKSGLALDRRFGSRLREDVAVPLGIVDRLMDSITSIAAEAKIPVYVYGHLGDGNLHPNFVIDPADPAAERIRERLLTETLRLGGTISAEHGIGWLKRSYLSGEIGVVGVELLRSLKHRCDPDGILNPGKLLEASSDVR